MRRLIVVFIVVSALLFPVAAFPQARSFLRGFAEQFTNAPVNWGIVKGKWTYGGGVLSGRPVANNTWSGIAFTPAVYSTLDYTVKMKRAGCVTCSVGITVRGNGPVAADGTWANGVHFLYANNGYFVIYKTVSGRATILKNWTPSSRIVNGGWNTIRVTAVRNIYKLYINNAFVTQVVDSSRTNGYVGLQMFSPTVSGNVVTVDWALLTTNVK